jgi:hypothetical protein
MLLLGDSQPCGLGHSGLPLIEGKEAVSLEFERGGDMQPVKCAGSQRGNMPLGECDAGGKGLLWLAGDNPYADGAILLKILVGGLGFRV